MENIIEQLSSNPLYLAIGVVLAIILVFGIIKKVAKLIIILAIALIAFAGYLHFTGREVPSSADKLKQSVSKQIDKLKNRHIKPSKMPFNPQRTICQKNREKIPGSESTGYGQ